MKILKGFTLAEVMITLTVIGIITAVILPVAFHSKPDENVMKFKKAHNTLYQVISTLVNSDKYCLDGDLGKMLDGSLVTSPTHFCEIFSDVVSVKKVNCTNISMPDGTVILNAQHLWMRDGGESGKAVTQEILDEGKTHLDTRCKDYATTIGEEIVLNDGTVFFDAKPTITFGERSSKCEWRRAYGYPACMYDNNGFNIAYKVFCMDIDGVGKGEEPFGYGIQADGTILVGKRASEWLEKSIQE